MFESLNVVKDELNSKILELSPRGCANYEQIPIMSLGEDIGQKSIIDVKAKDAIQGFIVQDVLEPEGEVSRQIIFEEKFDQIQSEIQIVFKDPKKHELPAHLLANTEVKKKKGKTAVLNTEFLVSEYQQAMLAGLYQVPSLAFEENQKLNILHLGTGAGVMPSFLQSQLGDKLHRVTTVDLNKDIVTLAQKYFGFNPEHEQIESVIADAHKYVLDCNQKFDIIICDVNCTMEDQTISPPWNFFSEEFLTKLVSLLEDQASYLAMNILYYDEASKKRVFESLKSHIRPKVDKISFLEMEDWSNKLFVATRDSKTKSDIWRSNPSIEGIVDNSKTLENLLKNWKVQNRGSWIKDMEMGEHILNFVDFDKQK